MVKKIFFDENENELEFFINDENRLVITIKYDEDISHICLNESDLKELQKELQILVLKIKDNGI